MRKDTEQVIKDFNIKTFGSKKNIQNLEALFSPHEEVLYISPTIVTITHKPRREVKSGSLVVTDTALVSEKFTVGVFALTSKSIFAFTALATDISPANFSYNCPLYEVFTVECSSRMLGLASGIIKISTSRFNVEVVATYKKEVLTKIQTVFDEAIQISKKNERAQAKQVKQVNQAPLPPVDDIPAQIKKLADLRDSGILSEDEFQAKKTELLSRI